LINKTLGQLPAGQAPPVKFAKEAPFKGRELVEVRLTPYDEMAMAYRTVTAEHPDHAAIDVCLRVLNNSNGVGMLDLLRINNKVYVAGSGFFDFEDESAAIIQVVPKIDPEFFDDPVFLSQMERVQTEAEARNLQTRFIAQARKEALKNAEAMVKSELNDLKNGDFDEILITAAKYELEQGYKRMLETLEGRARIVADAFVGRRTMEEQLGYVEKIKSVTKQDIMRVAKQYFGDNYLALWSRTGSPKKEKVDKPKVEPVIAVNRDVHSDFAKNLFAIPATETGARKYIDFDKDVTFTKLSNGNVF
jgi:predicted Zn-dependent peptidase